FERETAARARAETTGAQLALLAEASARLSTTLDYEDTVRHIVDLMVPDVADVCEIVPAGQEDEPARPRVSDDCSAMRVPLIARGEVLGILKMELTSAGRRYGLEDLGLAEELGHRCARALENAR